MEKLTQKLDKGHLYVTQNLPIVTRFFYNRCSMEKKNHSTVIALSIGVLALLSSVLAFYPSHTNTGASYPLSWMSHLADSTSLTTISIPGSHDSGSTKSVADIAGICQDATLEDQLDFGVRFLDIRLVNYQSKLVVCHGFINQDLAFSSVLSTLSKFLTAQPTETVLVSVKEEAKPIASTVSFEKLLSNEIKESKVSFCLDRTLPTLGNARGKAILLSRYENNSMGVDCYQGWSDPVDAATANTFALDNGYPLQVQDHYQLTDATTKEDEISAMLSLSEAYQVKRELPVPLAADTLYLNFASGYLVKSFPPSYSISIAKAVNPWLLTTLPKYDCTGVVIMDFVTDELCMTVFQRNSL